MTTATQADLAFKDYKWTARADHDDPKITHFPDDRELNRTEGYEVLSFINRFLKNVATKDGKPWSMAAVHKIENGVRTHPSNMRSHVKVKGWIIKNWATL